MDKIIVLKVDDASPIVMMKKNGLFTPMNDQEWKRRIHHYSYLHDAAKVKMQRKKYVRRKQPHPYPMRPASAYSGRLASELKGTFQSKKICGGGRKRS